MAKRPSWHVRVHQVRLTGHKFRAALADDLDLPTARAEHYSFSLQIGPYLINGFVYRRETGAILSPLKKIRGLLRPVFVTKGIHMNRIRELIEDEIDRQKESRAELDFLNHPRQ